LKLTVIITHHHTPQLLANCLRSLVRSLNNVEHEIIVTDNQCNGFDCLQSQWPKVKFLCFNQDQGYTRLVNSGLKKACGDYFLILNADTIIADGQIELMLEYYQKQSKIGLLGPRLVNPKGQWQPSCFREQTWLNIVARRTRLGKTKFGQRLISRLCYQDRNLRKIQTAEWLMGSVLLISREFLNKIGYLDERFKMYFSDADWARRARQAGLAVVYFPLAELTHCHQRSSHKGHGIFDLLFSPLARTHLLDAIKYFWKWKNQ